MPAARADGPTSPTTSYHDEGDPEMAGAARDRPAPRRRRRQPPRRLPRGARRATRSGSPAVIVLLVVLWFLNALFQPFHGDGPGRVAVRIPKGASVSEVGDMLEKRGVISGGPRVIDGSTLFQIRVTLAGKRSDLYAGHFTPAEGHELRRRDRRPLQGTVEERRSRRVTRR